MADVLEEISSEIVRRISEITTANGYELDLTDVSRPTRNELNAINHLSVRVVQGRVSLNQSLSHEGNPMAVAFDVTFNIECYVRLSDSSTTPYDTVCNQFNAAIITAITTEATDPSMWYTMEGNAVNCQFGSTTPMVTTDGANTGTVVQLRVLYRVSENNPSQSRA